MVKALANEENKISIKRRIKEINTTEKSSRRRGKRTRF